MGAARAAGGTCIPRARRLVALLAGHRVAEGVVDAVDAAVDAVVAGGGAIGPVALAVGVAGRFGLVLPAVLVVGVAAHAHAVDVVVVERAEVVVVGPAGSVVRPDVGAWAAGRER